MSESSLNLGSAGNPDDDGQHVAPVPRRKREDKPFRVRRTGPGSNKVLFESNDEREVKRYVENNFPRPHHEADDHDVYVESPAGAKTAFTAGADNDGWGDYQTPREREDG